MAEPIKLTNIKLKGIWQTPELKNPTDTTDTQHLPWLIAYNNTWKNRIKEINKKGPSMDNLRYNATHLGRSISIANMFIDRNQKDTLGNFNDYINTKGYVIE